MPFDQLSYQMPLMRQDAYIAFSPKVDAARVALDPFEPAMVQPSSVDVRLDRFFRVFENHKYPHIDPAEDQPDLTRQVEPEGDEPFILHPGEFVLGSTYEVVTLPDDIANPQTSGRGLHRETNRREICS